MNVSMRDMANAIRFLSIDTIVHAKEGHPGTPCGGADIVTALYSRHMKFDPERPDWPDRDRFVHSAGHGSMLIYALLHLCGYREMSMHELKQFRKLGSKTAGHPEYHPSLGIETTTGPLGQGIANAVGMAVAEQILNHCFGDDIIDHYTYAYTGDGCLMEGVAAEVISLAGHLQLGKLVFLWDDNRMSDDGSTDIAFSEDTAGHFKASGWHVQENIDGLDAEAVDAAIILAKQDPRPSMIACRTKIAYGIPRVEDTRTGHGGVLSADDAREARENLNWPYQPFEIPQNIRHAWQQAGNNGKAQRQAWEKRVKQLSEYDQAELSRYLSRDFPQSWLDTIHQYKQRKSKQSDAQSTILASGELIDELSKLIPELISGAPDLEGTTQHKHEFSAFTRDNRGGRYIHYGVREHAMGSMINGMVLHGGLKVIGATYLVFSDYMRHSMRMAALMEIPSIFVFSHDSIGIGTNGATHQPVETLASLRAYPNMWVLRPADAVELAECWQLALTHNKGPTSIICSRQPLKILRHNHTDENLCTRGAYILAEAEGKRKVTLLATGSEVACAMQARTELQAKNIPTAVVSMPSWELFEQQDEVYRKTIIHPNTVRIGIEAAVRLGWDRYIGENGGFVGMSSFGASAPYPELFQHFDITATRVVKEAESRLQSRI